MSKFRSLLSVAIFALCGLAGFAGVGAQPSHAASRIKDIADFEGVRDNMLVGYGLVVGLNGTGDTLSKAVFTRESLIGMLERLGVNARDEQSADRQRRRSDGDRHPSRFLPPGRAY